MKEKCLNFLSTAVSTVKQNKKIAIAILAILLIVIIIIVIAVNGGKPSKYQEKIKNVTKALSSESKMKKAIGDVIDLRGAATWQEVNQKAADFNKEYKNIKKDGDEAKELERALKQYAENNEKKGYEVKVRNIKEPKKNSNNKKIYTVSSTFVTNQYGSEKETDVRFIFYNGKIIDIMEKDTNTSYFKAILKENKNNKKKNASESI